MNKAVAAIWAGAERDGVSLKVGMPVQQEVETWGVWVAAVPTRPASCSPVLPPPPPHRLPWRLERARCVRVVDKCYLRT